MKKLDLVLVVEPNPPGILRGLIEASSCANVVRTAGTYGEAFTALHERQADGVVLDLGLEEGGPEIVRSIRSLIGGAPLVAITDSEALAEAAVLEGGADDGLERATVNGAALSRALRFAAHRRRAAAELAAAEARNRRLAAIIEAADDLVLLIDSSERVFFMNQAARRFFGDPLLHAIPSLRAAALFDAAEPDDFWHEVLPDVLLGGYWQGDIRLENVHGVAVRHAVTLMHHERIGADDHAYFSIVCHDLSALEAAAERAHMRRLIRAKDQFIATVSHELRTPLTAVLGFAEMLYSGSFDGDLQGSAEATEMIFSQAQEVSDIIEDLLVGARVDMGTVAVRPVEMELSAEVASVAGALRDIDGKDVRLEISEGTLVNADPLRVRQIVRNLLTNAVRYGGDIVRVASATDDERVRLTVSDNGPGVPEDTRAEIFEPFRSGAVSPPPAAMGLGLTVSRGLAEVMGGALGYDYIDGWSEFRLDLPAVVR